MINTSRLNDIDAIVIRLTNTTATNLGNLKTALLAARFSEGEAITIIQTMIPSLLAIANPVEQLNPSQP